MSMIRFVLIALLACATSVASARQSPVGPVRVIAEWEPVDTVVVRDPRVHAPEAIRAMHEAASLTLLVSSAAEEANYRAFLTSPVGIDPDEAAWVWTAEPFSIWPRDWGPYCVFDGTGQMGIVDPLWQGYPSMPQSCGASISIWTPSEDDTTANTEIASALGLPRYEMPAYATGGNVLVDGFDRAFSSCLQLAENAPVNSESQLRAIFDQYLGVGDYRFMANWETSGIQHVDCWMKLVDEETILVKRPPAGHPEEAPTEANVAILESLLTPWGRPYRIIRVDTPPYDAQGRLANYLNSIIINDHVLVPMFNTWADDDAIAAFQAALPGYTVVPLSFGQYNYTDAVHCRARSIFDREMLRLTHAPIRGVVPSQPSGYAVTMTAASMAGHALIPGEAKLFWRESGDSFWSEVVLTSVGGSPEAFAGLIPGAASGVERGDVIEYRVQAADSSGRVESLPRAGAYAFEIEDDRLTIAPESAPSIASAGDLLTVRVAVDPRTEGLVPGTVRLQYAYAPGSYNTMGMSDLGGGVFEATAPGGRCDELVTLYVEAEGTSSGLRTWPRDGASSPHVVEIGDVETLPLRVESFEGGLPSDMGAGGLWIVTGSCAPSSGGCGGGMSAAFVNPATCDYDTGAAESGDLTLTVDLSGVSPDASPRLSFCSFLHTEQTDYGFLGYDVSSVLINGVVADSPGEALAWETREIDLSAHAGGPVEIRWRFDTVDEQYNAYPGWRVDDIRVERSGLACVGGPCAGDADGDGDVDFDDLNAILPRWDQSVAAGGVGDLTRDGRIDFEDLNETLSQWGAACP